MHILHTKSITIIVEFLSYEKVSNSPLLIIHSMISWVRILIIILTITQQVFNNFILCFLFSFWIKGFCTKDASNFKILLS